MIIVWISRLLFFQCLTQSRGQLVRAGCVLVAATDALQLAHDIGGLHAAHQRRDALQIAMATTIELNVLDITLLVNLEVNL